MAYDEQGGRRAPGWRGDDSFGGGWGNQVPRPHRMRGRDWRDPGDEADPGWYDDDIVGARFRRAGVGDFGHDLLGGAARNFALTRDDPHYSDWRDRQLAALDRDYDEYRREKQSRFDRDFGDWRARRGEQRAALGRVAPRMAVTGADGGHVGTVDCTRGDRIILTRGDEAAGGVHHVIPCGWIARVDDKVVLNLDADEARARWQNEHRSRALFEREGHGARGPHVLNRSFAGTYPDEE